MIALYNMILFIAALVALPYYGAKIAFTGKYRKSIGPKLGFVRRDVFADMRGSPRIWIHAVSVGEVIASTPIIATLRKDFPEACLVLSTSTETGQEVARRITAGITAAIYYPLDIPWSIRKVMNLVKPDLFVLTETELWPNFLRICGERGVKVAMVNGRVSPRSYRGYRMTRFFWRKVIGAIDGAGVISDIDACRLREIGMPPVRIAVLGNAKYDSMTAEASPGWKEEIARIVNFTAQDRVLVAGSTHEGEERIVLDVYKRLLLDDPAFKLVIVPRHIERGRAVLEEVKTAGFPDAITMTEIRGGRSRLDERVIVVDVIGELFKVYSLATVSFCGGSLAPKGGHNILEPAAWGKIVFYGPFMDDFREEKAILEAAGAGITVRNKDELYEGICALLRDPAELAARGERGRAAVSANMGAARRYADMIARVLNSDTNSARGRSLPTASS